MRYKFFVLFLLFYLMDMVVLPINKRIKQEKETEKDMFKQAEYRRRVGARETRKDNSNLAFDLCPSRAVTAQRTI